MTTAKKRGRPPLDVETVVVSVRLTAAEHAKITKAAKKIDRSISRVCAKGAMELAEKILESPQTW